MPPARLGEYLRAITRLWDEYGYTGSWSGHFGQGCVHTRNNFELASPAGRAAFRSYVERAADLVVSLGGSLSGEHGDGQARGELLGRMYGPELVEAFAAFKAVFDPRGRMNPGNLVDPRPLDEDLRYGPVPSRVDARRRRSRRSRATGAPSSWPPSGAWASAGAGATTRVRCARPTAPPATSGTPRAAGRRCSRSCSRAR